MMIPSRVITLQIGTANNIPFPLCFLNDIDFLSSHVFAIQNGICTLFSSSFLLLKMGFAPFFPPPFSSFKTGCSLLFLPHFRSLKMGEGRVGAVFQFAFDEFTAVLLKRFIIKRIPGSIDTCL
jgi:hypothetical protein